MLTRTFHVHSAASCDRIPCLQRLAMNHANIFELICRKTILAILSILCLSASPNALAKKANDAALLTPQQMKEAVYLDAMSIPCPGESFAAINKVSRPNWSTLVYGGNAPVTTRRAQLALAIGVFVTNGYIAVEAQDGQQVKNIGRDMMAMSKALGVSQTILSRGNNLIEFADHNEWDSLRNELEATENEVKTTMVDQQDRNLVTLTSAGAWLRGLEIATGIIASHYSERGAALLEEPDLARHLASELEALPEKLRNDPLVMKVKETLLHVASLLEKRSHGLTKADLDFIQAETRKVIIEIGTSDASPFSPPRVTRSTP